MVVQGSGQPSVDVVSEPGPSDPRKQNKARRRRASTRPRVRPEEFAILSFGEQQRLLDRNYKKEYLKRMCSHYGLRVGGNKDQLQARVWEHLRASVPALVVQRFWRRAAIRACARLRGPAFVNRTSSVNETDFYSMSPCVDIPTAQFTSLRDTNGRTYSFDILSLATLFGKNGRGAVNPYNRQPFASTAYADLKRLIRLARAIGHTVATRPQAPPAETAAQRSSSLFHDIYLLGHYPSPDWFDQLSRGEAVRYMRELMDIWRHRATLDRRTQCEICPPDGDPFRDVSMRGIEVRPEAEVKLSAVHVMSRMVRDGLSEDNRKLGAYYVLCALTLVNSEAAAEMPFLYAAVAPEAEG
jgi:hypothetical protein